MERFEIQDNQFIKKNVINTFGKTSLLHLIKEPLVKWDTKGKSGKYQETTDGKQWPDCSKVNHYLCQYYRKTINPINDDNSKRKQNNEYDYLELIAEFLNAGDVLYALTITDIMKRVAEKAIIRIEEDNKGVLQDFISKLDELRYNIEHDADLFQNVRRNEDTKLDKKLDGVRKKINKELIYKIDGVTALTREIGTDTFIKYAIDQCYFFEPDVAKNRMDKIVKTFQAQHTEDGFMGKKYDLFARFSTMDESGTGTYKQTIDDDQLSRKRKEKKEKEKEKKQQDNITEELNDDDSQDGNGEPDEGNKKKKKIRYYLFTETSSTFVKEGEKLENYPIIRDNDGNAKVRSVINEITGYTVSAGKENIFQNYRISHVWGRAFDPRYFTNLWNIVIVPSWANDLLDKPNAIKGTLESKLQSTIMKICEMLYFNNKCISTQDVQHLIMPDYPKIINENDVISSTQEIEKDHAIPNERIINKSDNINPYLINIIEGKRGKTLGDIVKYAVYI